MDNYAHDYRILGASPGCSLQTLKTVRRRLLKTWHPDHFPTGSADRVRAEERIKDINTAFDRLHEYHQTFGVLPDLRSDTPARAAAPPWYDEPSHAAPLHSRSPIRWAAIAAIIALVALSARMLLRNADDSVPNDISSAPQTYETPSPATESRSSPDKYFTVGSSLGDVYAAQGVPTSIENGVWHYGKSKVYFADGVVVSWEHDPANPLNTTVLPVSSGKESTSFTLGASKAKVRAVQGTPWVETDSLWDYGLSKIYFRDNVVVGWDSSPMQPLKARR